MGKRFFNLTKEFLENPHRSKIAFWLIGIESTVGCVVLAAFGFVKDGIGAAVLYGLGGWLWGAIQGVVLTVCVWLLLRVVAVLRSGKRLP